MDFDDIIYLLLLVFSVGFGDRYRKIADPYQRQLVGSLVGFLLMWFVSGLHVLHPIFSTTINALIILKMDPRYCHMASFAFSFSYLLFFRCSHYFGIPNAPAHTNAIQMILTLKLVGLAFEVHDSANRRFNLKKQAETLVNKAPSSELTEEFGKLSLSQRYQEVSPNLADIFHYVFCYIGSLTGPYYKYRTYYDMFYAPYSQKAPCRTAAWQRVKIVPFYALWFAFANHFFPLSFARSDSVIFTQHSVWYRLFYMTPIFFTFRMRIYVGLILAECSCIMAGLGAYPKLAQSTSGNGPTQFAPLELPPTKMDETTEFDFNTVRSMDEWDVEFATTARGGMKSWNMTVQYWLAVNVYKRFRIKSVRTAITMLTSAFWHGVHSGYYLSMLTVPFVLIVEDLAIKRFRNLAPALFDIGCWFMRMQWFAYMSMAFLLLEIHTTLHYWKSIYFIGHVAVIFIWAVVKFAPRKTSPVSQTAPQREADTRLKVTKTE